MFQHDCKPREIDLKDKLIAVYIDDDQPVLFYLGGTFFLPLFSTPEKLVEAMAIAGVKAFHVKTITDHDDFLDSVAGQVRLMLDPWRTEHGTTRFTELRLP